MDKCLSHLVIADPYQCNSWQGICLHQHEHEDDLQKHSSEWNFNYLAWSSSWWKSGWRRKRRHWQQRVSIFSQLFCSKKGNGPLRNCDSELWKPCNGRRSDSCWSLNLKFRFVDCKQSNYLTLTQKHSWPIQDIFKRTNYFFEQNFSHIGPTLT